MRRRANSPPLVPSESAPSSILDGESARERRAVTTLRPAPLAWPYALLFALPIKMTTEVVAEHERMLCGLLASGLRVAILRGGEACTSAGLLVVLVSACVTVTRGGGDGERGRSDDRHLMRSEAMRGRFRRFRVFGIVDGVGGIAAAELLQQHNFTLSTAREVALTASIVRRTLRSEVSGLEPLAAFPLQDVEFNKWLRAKRAHKSMSTEQFLNEVRDHFGERVAFYFAFVDSFVNSLLLLATICVVIYVLLGSSLPHHAGELLLKTAGVGAAEAAAAAEADGEREAEMGVFRLLLAHAPRGQRLIRGVGRTLLRVAELHDWTAYLCVCPILGLAAAACWGPFFVRMWTRRAATLNARWLTRDPLLGLNVGTSGATAEQVVESDQRNPHQSLARLEYETAAAANNDTGGNASPSSSSSTSSHRRRRVAALRVWVRWCGNPCTFLFNAVVLLFVNILFLQWYSYGLMAPSCYCCALIHDASTELVRVEFEPQPDDYLPHEGLPPGEWTARSALEQAHRAVQHAQRKADRAVRQKTTSTWWTTTFREAPKKEDGRLRSIAIDASALHAALRANAPQCASDVSFGIDGLGFDPSSHLHSCTRWITCFDAPPPRHQKKQRRRARKQKRRRRSTTGTGTGTAIATSKSKTGHQVGSDRWVYILVQSMVLAIAMDLVQYELFHRITQALTWYENWSWTAKYERALVRKQVVFFSLNAFSWFFLVAFVMVPYGGELQIWLHQQELRLPFLQRKFSLALIVPPHGWIDGLLDIDGLFVTTLAVTQFSKLLSSFVLPWIVVKCTRAQLGCARSARLRARAALRGMRLRLRRCGDCDPIDPNWKVQQRRIRRMRGRAAAKLLHTSSRSAGKLPQHTVGGAAFDEPRGGGLAVVNVCRRALGCILSCCHSHAAQVRSSPARLAAAGIATERVSVAMSRARQSNARTPQIEIMRGSSAAPLPKSKAKAKRSRQARAGKKAMRERGGLNPCGSTEGQLQHEAHVELVQRHASLDNNVTYEVALFELVTAKLLRTAQPLDSFVLLSSASAEPVATAAEVALASGPIALPPSQTRAGVRALDVWEQARRAPFDESSSYIALVLQFGYVTLFTVAWPLAPLCAVLHNAIQSRCMFGNLCVSTQRPAPRIDNGASAWVSSFTAMHTAAAFVVAALFAFATGQLEAWVGCSHHHEMRLNDGTSASGERMAPVRSCFSPSALESQSQTDSLNWALGFIYALGGGWACRLVPLFLVERLGALCVWGVNSLYPALSTADTAASARRARRAEIDLEEAVAPAMIAHWMQHATGGGGDSGRDGGGRGLSPRGSGGGASPPRSNLSSALATATTFREHFRPIFAHFDRDSDHALSRAELRAFIDALHALTPGEATRGPKLSERQHARLFRELKLLPDNDLVELELRGAVNALGFNELVVALAHVNDSWTSRHLIGPVVQYLLQKPREVARAIASSPRS